ncbi:MAG: acetyl-CoA carboxylase biotin carboxylase subunit [Flavobacteriales bacterium]|nr:acetyl-CoA carboxylase biotin carboxylase subunit [Flavobacteriales bacterium]
MKKILIANRGEIALRIIRTCKEQNIETVAVYSDADRNAPFVEQADEAVNIGPAPSKESYLLIDKILDVANSKNVDAIHPGYGFLSENAEFAEAVEANGKIFIGPSSHAIRVMGDKLSAKEAVMEFGVPLVPGTEYAIEDPVEGAKIAKEIGYPVLIKASAGGGGKGMRTVFDESNFAEQMQLAINEATSAFGNGSVFIEKFVTSPRHIEIQVLADKHGNAVHLFERECSVQRRHQKVVEEAPSAILSDQLRQEMGECAIQVAKSCGYYNAGTVEFLLDDKMNFYFLEMNTRLQVEHPVTEEITGVDLVKEQIRIAEGKKLPFTQEDLSIKGHAIELRVYAEDPTNQFLPDIGNLSVYRTPEGPGVRVDSGFEEGMDIPIFYDPMISKLICYAGTREDAINRMKRAIDEYQIVGIKSTLSFGKFVMEHEKFIQGDFDTNFVKDHFSPDKLSTKNEMEEEVGAIFAAIFDKGNTVKKPINASTSQSKWKKNRL